ncbi:MAG: hypothetical protein IJ198_12970 [Lachnospiraceae bacterium]|nr:hypothetical protein [Lachnospiraceae bacterium]
MYFLKNLYVGPSIHDPEKVKRSLISGAGQFTIYVICLSPSAPGPGANQLEILHCVNLQQPYYKKYPPYIIGIADGMIEAVEMVRDLVQESYEHTGSGDVRAYLFPHGTRIIYPAHAAPKNLLPVGEEDSAFSTEADGSGAEQEEE